MRDLAKSISTLSNITIVVDYVSLIGYLRLLFSQNSFISVVSSELDIAFKDIKVILAVPKNNLALLLVFEPSAFKKNLAVHLTRHVKQLSDLSKQLHLIFRQRFSLVQLVCLGILRIRRNITLVALITLAGVFFDQRLHLVLLEVRNQGTLVPLHGVRGNELVQTKDVEQLHDVSLVGKSVGGLLIALHTLDFVFKPALAPACEAAAD